MRVSAVLIALWIAYLAPLKSAYAGTLERLEASVNSQIILLSDLVQFRKAYKLRTQLDPLFQETSLARKGDGAPDSEIVEFLIDEKLIQQEFPISDAEVEQEITSIQSNNHISRTGLKAALKTQGFTFEQYFELIRISLAKRTLIDRDIRTKVLISDEDVQNHLNLKGDLIQIPSAFKIRIITIFPTNYRKKSEARQVALQAYDALKAGESFEAVARRMSEDPSGSVGGDLGFVSEEDLSPDLKKVVTKLKAGEFSNVYGDEKSSFFIVKLEELKTKQEDRVTKLKEDVRNQLAAQEYSRQIALWLQRQRQRSFIHLAGQPTLK